MHPVKEKTGAAQKLSENLHSRYTSTNMLTTVVLQLSGISQKKIFQKFDVARLNDNKVF